MFRHGEISTETDKKPFVFTLIALVIGAAATALFLIFGWKQPLAIFAGILFGIVTVAAGAVLFALVSDRAYIEGDTLHTRYLLKKRAIRISEIGKISYRNDVYYIYGSKDELVATVNGKLTGIDSVIYTLDRNGVRFV